MKVIYRSQNKLTMEFYPWFKWMFVGLFNFIGIVCLLTIPTVTWNTFDCNRTLTFSTQGQCTLTHHSWMDKSQQSWQLEQIQGISREQEGFQKNGSPRYRIDLHTKEEVVTIVGSSTTDFSPGIAEEIQYFFNNSQQLSYEQRDSRPHILLPFIYCLAFALLFSILGTKVTLNISKYSQKLTLQRRNLFLTRTVTYPLDQIVDVIVQKQRGGKFGLMGRLVMVLKGGKKIVIHDYDRLDMEARSHESAALLCRFLNL